MTATKTATAPSRYRSGWCSSGYHDRCRGTYAGVDCTCPHHQPEAEPEPDEITVHCFFGCPHVVQEPTPEAAHAVMELHYFEAHRVDIARAVGWVSA